MSVRYDCFISYASGDVSLARVLHDRLVQAGFTVWFDKIRLRPGFDWYKEIETGCNQSRIFLPVLTPEWKKSEWTRFETYGRDTIIPIVFRGNWDEVKTGPLSRWQAQFLDVGATEDDKWSAIFESIRDLLARPRPDRAARIANLRFRPNPYFVGREGALVEICESLHDFQTTALTQGAVRAISALGGVGKTTLANEYAHRFWRLYSQIFWVDARLGYEPEFARICGAMFPDLSLGDLTQSEKAAIALRGLSDRGERLLVIDNVVDEKSCSKWIPRTGDCRVLLTTRFWDFSPSVRAIRVDVLEAAPAREFLIARSAHDNTKDELVASDKLAQTLGYLPLALEIAAAYVNLQGREFGFADYLRLYEGATKELLSEHRLGSTEYPDPIITTWKATVEKLEPEARALLRICSSMAATPIPLDILFQEAETVLRLASDFGPVKQLSSSRRRELRMRRAAGLLKSYSMANFDGANLQFHPLVQAVEWLNATEREQQFAVECAVDILVSSFPDDNSENPPLSEMLSPHVEQVSRFASSSIGAPLALLTMVAGDYLRLNSQFARAEPLLRLAITIDEGNYGMEHLEVATDLNSLGLLLEETNQFAEAELIYRRALAIREAQCGPNHTEVATVLNNIAGLLHSTGRYVEAEASYRRALDIEETVYGSDSPEVAHCLNNLAFLLEYLNRLREAEPLYRRALAIDEKTYGLDHPDVARDLINLVDLLVETNRIGEAEPLCRRALEIDEIVHGPDHPEVATDLCSLAFLLYSDNRFAEAESLYRRSLNIYEASYGADHAKVALDLGFLADLLAVTNRPLEAEAYYRRALEINESIYGPDHPDVARALSKLADILSKMGRDVDALPMSERAVIILLQSFGPNHTWTEDAREVAKGVLSRFGGRAVD